MKQRILMEKSQIAEMEENICEAILNGNKDMDKLLLIGIQRRGADIAKRLSDKLNSKTGQQIAYGSLDINLYRDDWTTLLGGVPHIGISRIPFNIDNKKIILVDDVLFTGRTIRAALEALMDYGRPDAIELCVFIDRGHRELPICAKYIGKFVETQKDDHIDVLLEERDGKDAVILSN